MKIKNTTLCRMVLSDPKPVQEAINNSLKECDFDDIKIFGKNLNIKYRANIDINDYDLYCHFMVKKMYDFILTDYLLFVHHDGYILNGQAWSDLWYNYDYIGAPWWHHDNNVGNGGFTFRSKKLLKILKEDDNIKPILNDNICHNFTPLDHIICRIYGDYLKSLGVKFAPESEAIKFSILGNPKHGYKWDGQFGFHNNKITDISLAKVDK